MANRVNAADRNLLLGVVAVLVLLSLLIGTAGVPENPSEALPIPSSYSSKPGGASAAYALLQQLQYPVRRWEEPPARLKVVESNAVLIFAEPSDTPTPGERTYLRRFVEKGGRVLFCGGALPSFFEGVSLTFNSAADDDAVIPPGLPSPFTRGAKKLAISPDWFWKKRTSNQIALFGGEQEPVAVVWRIGKGEVLWWAAATPLTNQAIVNADNVTVFLDAVSGDASGARPVYWDEYFHGARGSLWSYVASTPLKFALLQCLLLFGAVLFAFSRRSGPIVIPGRVSRQSPLEFVDTMGGLYQRAGATSVATGIAYRHFRLTLSRRLLLPSTAPDATLAKAAEQRLGWSGEELSLVLAKAELSQHLNTRAGDALGLVKSIGKYLDRLAQRRPALNTSTEMK